MIHIRSLVIVRSMFTICKTLLTNDNVVNNTTKENKASMIEAAVNISLDHHQGTIQHKTTVAKHIINELFDGPAFYEEFKKQTGIENIFAVSGKAKINIIAEFPALLAYTKEFDPRALVIRANLDSVRGDYFAQKQTNQDFTVWVPNSLYKEPLPPLDYTKPLEEILKDLPVTHYVMRPQDEKSGMNMLSSATRGYLGILTYDKAMGDFVPVFKEPFSVTSLPIHDHSHLQHLDAGLKHDRMGDQFAKHIKNATDILNTETKQTQFSVHKEYNGYIWNNFQRNPLYNRSTSFVFIEEIDSSKMLLDDNFNKFHTEFIKILGNKNTYDLNKRGDCQTICYAMLKAYKTVDPLIYKKIAHLQHVGNLEFNKKFLEDLAQFLKQEAITHYT